MFSSSECVISRVLSRFYLSEGRYALLCFFVLAIVVLRNAAISRVLAWFWVGFGKIAFFYDTVFFWHFGILDFLRFFLGCCYFSSFR